MALSILERVQGYTSEMTRNPRYMYFYMNSKKKNSGFSLSFKR